MMGTQTLVPQNFPQRNTKVAAESDYSLFWNSGQYRMPFRNKSIGSSYLLRYLTDNDRIPFNRGTLPAIRTPQRPTSRAPYFPASRTARSG